MKIYRTEEHLYTTEKDAYNECYEKIVYRHENWYHFEKEASLSVTPIKITKKNNRTTFKFKYHLKGWGRKWSQVSYSYCEIEVP